jgi:hypothetical protein
VQQQLHELLGTVMLFGLIYQAAFGSDGAYRLEVQAAPIIMARENVPAAAPGNVDRHAACGGLAGDYSLAFGFDAMRHRVADHLDQWSLQGFEDVRVEPDVPAPAFEDHALA